MADNEEGGRALGKCNVKDVILVAKHESGPNIEEVNMFGSGGRGLAHLDSRSFWITRRSEKASGLLVCLICGAGESQSCCLCR